MTQTFNGLQSLKTLDLFSNNILQIQERAFAGLVKLLSLNLNRNVIKQLGTGTFTGE